MFPAYAGVFLPKEKLNPAAYSVPRIRGGVPALLMAALQYVECSPHTRGCSLHASDRADWIFVFPAYAGVFL